MLVSVCSLKGSPGVTSTALALAAVWPRPVVLLEADPAGGDLQYRCHTPDAAADGRGDAVPGLVKLAAAVRAGVPGPRVVSEQAERLGCGVSVVRGLVSAKQSRGIGGLWSTIAEACVRADVDVIADLGRLDPASPVMAIAAASSHVVPVASTSLESVMHLAAGLEDLMHALAQQRTQVAPVLLGPDASAARDCAEVDDLLEFVSLPVSATLPIAYDPRALERLEDGERGDGRLGRTLLLRRARAIAGTLNDQAPGVAGGAVSA
jgi:hypothetical protein